MEGKGKKDSKAIDEYQEHYAYAYICVCIQYGVNEKCQALLTITQNAAPWSLLVGNNLVHKLDALHLIRLQVPID